MTPHEALAVFELVDHHPYVAEHELVEARAALRLVVQGAPTLGEGDTAAGNPAARMPGESYKDHGARVYGMYRALLVDVERLRAIEQAARAWADIHNYPRGRSIVPVSQALHDALGTRAS